MKITFVGNCQMQDVAHCVGTMAPALEVAYVSPTPNSVTIETVDRVLGEPDILFVQPVAEGDLRARMIERSGLAISLPMLQFGGFHPDIVQARHDGKGFRCLRGSEHSALVLYGWIHGLTVDQTQALFRREVFAAIGYLDGWDRHVATFNDDPTDIALTHLLDPRRCFMHSPAHPGLDLTAGVARAVCDHIGLETVTRYPERMLADRLLAGLVMPIYPEIGESLNLPGEYAFKTGQRKTPLGDSVTILSLQEFITRSFEGYEGLDPALIESPIFSDSRFLNLRHFMPGHGPAAPATKAGAFVSVLCDEELYDPL